MSMFDKSYFHELQDYLQSSERDNLEGDKLEYYNALYTMVAMSRKYGRNKTIVTFMHAPFDCTRRTARRMYDEAVNLFFEDDTISNKAHRNQMYQELRAAATVVLRNSKTPKDMEVYGRLMEQAAKVKGLDKPDEKVRDVPPAKPITIYSVDPKMIGMRSEDRKMLAAQIDSIPDISMSEKARLQEEAMVKEINFTRLLDDTEEKTQDID